MAIHNSTTPAYSSDFNYSSDFLHFEFFSAHHHLTLNSFIDIKLILLQSTLTLEDIVCVYDKHVLDPITRSKITLEVSDVFTRFHSIVHYPRCINTRTYSAGEETFRGAKSVAVTILALLVVSTESVRLSDSVLSLRLCSMLFK